MNLKWYEVVYILGAVVFIYMLVSSAGVAPNSGGMAGVEVAYCEDVMASVWENESSPSDRRAMLEGLTAMECVEAGLCVLTLPEEIAPDPEWQ